MPRLTRVKKATTVASTFAIALGIGFVMQYGDADAARYTTDSATVVRDPVMIIDYSPLRKAQNFTLKPVVQTTRQVAEGQSLTVDPDSIKLTALVGELAEEASADPTSLRAASAAPRATCNVVAATAPSSTGSVMMQVVSDCRPNMPFVVSQAGLTFSAMTDIKGTAILNVPALAAEANFFLTFADGKSAGVSTYVPTAENYNRIVFQWEGGPGEYMTSNAIDAMMDRFGANSGNTPRFAEVYSFPADESIGDALTDVDLIAKVTDQNCNQVLVAESFAVFHGVDRSFKDIRITLPDCQELGAQIELKKVLGEQTIATR